MKSVEASKDERKLRRQRSISDGVDVVERSMSLTERVGGSDRGVGVLDSLEGGISH
jgi:hypothetical protein